MRAAGEPTRKRNACSFSAGRRERINIWPRRTCPAHNAEELER